MSDAFIGKKVLGRYRIVRAIGRGGMGLIYLARLEGAADFVKPVVVKRAPPEMLAEQPTLRELMGREARIMSHLHHPAIVNVIDFAEEDGAYLLVLDYVHGYHLGQWSRFLQKEKRPFPVALAIHVVCKTLDALHYANTTAGPDGSPLGVVHRDVSPSNILIDLDGTVKLADFGIARMDTDHTEATNAERLLKGKLGYMAPELLSFEPPTAQSDVYAAALVLHELLVGNNEMRISNSLETTALRIFHHVPTPPSDLRDDIPQGLDAVLAKGFAKAPADRYADARAFAHDLRALQPGTDDEMGRRLAAAIEVDFKNPRMPEAVGGHELSVLDRAWREAPRVVPEARRPPSGAPEARRPTSGAPTRLVAISDASPTGGPTAQRANKGRARALAPIAIGAGLVALGAGAYILAPRQAPAPVAAPTVLLLGGEVAGTDGLAFGAGVRSHAVDAPAAPSPVIPSATALASASSSPIAPPLAQPPPPPRNAGGAEGLTRAFAQREPQVASCFDKNAADVHGTPELAIRFSVDTQGHVTSAQVLPAEIGSTPLGTCLAGVARATQFAPQAQGVSFRIPIMARRGH